MKFLIINGPNLNLLGTREPDVYGSETLEQLTQHLTETVKSLEIELVFFQTNHEGDIVDRLGQARKEGIDGVVINPAAYTHTSIAIHDALKAVAIPAIEVHISNIHQREEFRRHSYTAPACIGQISGLGTDGYEWAIRALQRHLKH